MVFMATALFLKDKKMSKELTQDALVDALEYTPETGVFTWRKKIAHKVVIGARAGQLKPNGYRQIGIYGKRYPEHRLAILYTQGAWPADEVDHIDGNPSNNALSNLRTCSHAENHQNRSMPSHNRSGLQGVTWHRQKRLWRASVVLEGKHTHVGLFTDKSEAYEAYLKAKAQLHTFQPIPRDLCTSTS